MFSERKSNKVNMRTSWHGHVPVIDTYAEQIQACQRRVNKMNKKQNGTTGHMSSRLPTIRQECVFGSWPLNSSGVSRKSSISRQTFSKAAETKYPSCAGNVWATMARRMSRSSEVSLRDGQFCKIVVTGTHDSEPGSRSTKRHDSDLVDVLSRRGSRHNLESGFPHLKPGYRRSNPNSAHRKLSGEESNLLALATLAINEISKRSDVSRDSSRRSSLTPSLHRQSITTSILNGLQANRPRHQLLSEENQTLLSVFQQENADHTSSRLTGDTDETNSEDSGESTCLRIDMLREHLKSSGCGEPRLVTTNTERSEDDRERFAKLLSRMRRGDNAKRKDRLKRKAKLDYEMSMMKAESFCEQQDQVYMRTASADMKNRDIDLLEEELKYQALQEIKASRIREQQERRRLQKYGRLGKCPAQSGAGTRQREPDGLKYNGGENSEEEGDKEELEVSGVIQDGDRFLQEEEEEEEEDLLSGLLSSPLSKHEMRKRIMIWVGEVEKALSGKSGVGSSDMDRTDRT